MIEVKSLTYAYPDAPVDAISALDFSVERGEVFGFLGPSGAGKSTTQRVLTGQLRDYRGEACILGRDMRDWGPDVYERIGVSFELPNHFLKLTGLENLQCFGALYQPPLHDARQLLESVGLADSMDQRVSDYSKGMMTRLGVARALLHRPELVFMDEPTAGLDPVSARRIKRLIAGLGEAGTTVFLSTHDMLAADELCDRVAFIAAGSIAAIDRPRDLKLEHGRPQVVVEYATANERHSQSFALDGLGANADFAHLLRDHEIQTIHSQEASLDEVFVQVTGQQLA